MCCHPPFPPSHMLTHLHSSPLTLSHKSPFGESPSGGHDPPPFTPDGGTKTGGELKLTPNGRLSSATLAAPLPEPRSCCRDPGDRDTPPPPPPKSLRLVKPTKASPGIWDQLTEHTHRETHKSGNTHPGAAAVCQGPKTKQTTEHNIDIQYIT